MGLKRTFRQRSFSSIFAGWPVLAAESAHRMPFADPSELRSVFDRRSTVKEARRVVLGRRDELSLRQCALVHFAHQ
jgi:hypothetical protein